MSEFDDQQEIYATLVEINQEPTELYKILKFEHIVSGGGEAKQVISEGYVYLNGEQETRKRKKIYAGDVLYFNEQYFQVALKGQTGDYDVVDTLPETDSLSEDSRAKSTQSEIKSKKTRKPISF